MAKWDNVRRDLADAISFVRGVESAKAENGITLASSIAEAILSIDSSQVDSITSQSDGTIEFGEANVRARKGKLQRVRDMRRLYFGTSGSDGLLDRLKELDPPEYTKT